MLESVAEAVRNCDWTKPSDVFERLKYHFAEYIWRSQKRQTAFFSWITVCLWHLGSWLLWIDSCSAEWTSDGFIRANEAFVEGTISVSLSSNVRLDAERCLCGFNEDVAPWDVSQCNDHLLQISPLFFLSVWTNYSFGNLFTLSVQFFPEITPSHDSRICSDWAH